MAPRSSPRSRSTTRSQKRAEKENAGSLARFILTVAIIAWVFRSFIAQPFNIPSGSMLPTLYIGDYLIVAKWPYGYSRYSLPFSFPRVRGQVFGGLPSRGDVVVFRHPSEDADLIKRVIGLPGDKVAVRGGRLILNGKLVPRRPLPRASVAIVSNSPCYRVPPSTPTIVRSGSRTMCLYPAFLETLPGGPSFTVLDQVHNAPADDFPETIVPAAHVFLMGDNRDDSLDSRFPASEGGISMVPTENLIGRAAFTFWSTDGSASYLKPWTWFTALRGERVANTYNGARR